MRKLLKKLFHRCSCDTTVFKNGKIRKFKSWNDAILYMMS